MKVVYWWRMSIDESCFLMKVVFWWKLSIDESYLLMNVVYWWKLFFDESCLLMKVAYWWKLSFDECCLLMKVVQCWKLPIDESYNSQRSDILRRFACGDVLSKSKMWYLVTFCLWRCFVIVKEVISCDVSPVAMFCQSTEGRGVIND